MPTSQNNYLTLVVPSTTSRCGRAQKVGRAHVVVRLPQVEQLRVELSQQKLKAKSEQDRQLKKLQERLTKTEVRKCWSLVFAGMYFKCGEGGCRSPMKN